jgi:hypothetical protein
MKSILLIIVLWFQAGAAFAAEVTIARFDTTTDETPSYSNDNFGRPYISIVGEIAAGDFERVKLAATALSDMGVPLVIRLDSPGGNIEEALKIADLVRGLWGTTWILGRSAGVGDPDRSIATCDSACAFIFFAGIERRYTMSNLRFYDADDPYIIPQEYVFTGRWLSDAVLKSAGIQAPLMKTELIPVLGMHRPYFEQSFNGSLSGEEAQSLYSALDTEVSEKLKSFGVPDSLVRRMMKTSSAKIDRIDQKELFELMPVVEPWFEEWRLAKCGSLSQDESTDYWSAKMERDPNFGTTATQRRYSDSYWQFLAGRKASVDQCNLELLLDRQSQAPDAAE